MSKTVRLSPKLVKHEHNGNVYYYHWCSACKYCHMYDLPRWTYNGSSDKPTFSPSMRIFYTRNQVEKTTCHYFLTNGVIEYCTDSPHELSGKKVPLEDIPPNYEFSGKAFKDLPTA